MKQRALKSLVKGSGWCPCLFAQQVLPAGAGQRYIKVNNLPPAVVTSLWGLPVLGVEAH